jgi:hypothetical protein
MFNFLMAATVLISLLIILFMCVVWGRRYGKWRLAHNAKHKLEIVNVAEGSVFALLGLLVAFTFSSAYERFEARKIYIMEEANAMDTAFLRIDLLAPATQPALRKTFRDYVASRANIYRRLPDIDSIDTALQWSLNLRNQIWSQAVAACNITNNQATTQLFIGAVNSMFEIAKTRMDTTKIHPPIIIFALLIILAMVGSFLAGYSTAKHTMSNSIHILSYVAITALTIYVIIELETPRIGLIRVDKFDQILDEVHDTIQI